MHVDDLAVACLFLVQQYESEDIVNIGVGDDIKIIDLPEMVQDVVGFVGEVIWDSSKPDRTPHKLMDVSRLNKLGWQAEISLRDGVEAVHVQYCKDYDISDEGN